MNLTNIIKEREKEFDKKYSKIAIIEEIIEQMEEEMMDLELLNNAKMNGNFKKLDMKESIGWNKALKQQISQLKKTLQELK